MISIQIKEAQKVNGDLSAFISFPYDAELVGLMRKQSSRFWHAANKEWEIPANKLPQIINSVKDKEITITGDYKALAPKEVKIPKGFNFKTNPFDHQIEGFEFGLKHDRFLLGDEQGLGKTKQVIDIAVAKKLS
ncbi:MAG: hypothetical protein GX367_09915, partial [Bacteroidales bacterium]|nr:hypothetical protein [Bacteroidales bacterium]